MPITPSPPKGCAESATFKFTLFSSGLTTTCYTYFFFASATTHCIIPILQRTDALQELDTPLKVIIRF